MGRRRDDLSRGYRGATALQYLILYRIAGKDVEIARVIHGRRDLNAALGE